MAANRRRHVLIALTLLVAVVAAGGVLVAGDTLLQDGTDNDTAANDTAVPENRTVDVDRINLTVTLEPSDDLEGDLDYELVVIGEIAAANDAANDTVECNGELCVVNGTLGADADGDERPRYELRGIVTAATPSEGFTAHVNGTLEGDAIEGIGLGAYNVTAPNATGGGINDSVVRADGGGVSGETSAATVQSSESEESDGAAESASVTFEDCSTATVEGDAYAYEAGLRYYVSSGLDTSTIDESDISTPTTIDGAAFVGDARTTDVVIETVLVLDEEFNVVEQVSNPDYEDCVERIEQQQADEESGQNAAA
ncbi:hypothetical protein SAMN06269185_0817 [Natronoarchaeum philippinense]|uniref:Uncharacterized protein n=1 Tax=Natronoarchaeum philippinense TaxID=558529 RepID=A0A285N781_NATPI|nr:hypothetical protein [Natronoarchaeum philippinense]SNZ05280.1 hypothetical protein SAMN06269185_0817 [Natronoarchaeum philippinense]